MSRSRRHAPHIGICGGGAGPYRRWRTGQERARVRCLLATGRIDEAGWEQVPWDEWQTSRDGKFWMGDEPASELRRVLRK